VLRHLSPIADPNVLVGAATSDDAAVYRLTPDLAAVATVDYITPVVDDPYTFGAVAAANSLSDVYAMGARPLFALSLVNFPRDTLPFSVLEEIVRGGAAKATEAGIAIVGGHSVDDPEPTFGLAVYGVVHPDRIVRNVGARPGDRLVLTKPLGSGILLTAFKWGLLGEPELAPLVASMLRLNRDAAEAMLEVGVHAATDVTGFGLLGHALEMARGSGVVAQIEFQAVPFFDGALAWAQRDSVPSGTRRNLEATASEVVWEGSFDVPRRLLLADAQTSGGLLMSVSGDREPALIAALAARGVVAATVGEVRAGPGRLVVR
jgi:selenide,water dikinase